MIRRTMRSAVPLTVLGVVLGGCASAPTNIAPMPPSNYTVLGKATGSACGSLGILSTAYNFIPMGLNSRVKRAYDEAVASIPGASSLINVEMSESWYWWLIGTARCVTITGDAVKEGA